ncbi:hypothetical protein [Haloarchaeobius sp. DT45]|uniref:hypothetical protein n=1 Tax=Haloarchaeobius sp. DT45 TaxID=3446116 RepID=UPI003F6C3D56
MDFRSDRDRRDVSDVVVCADVLGGFGVSADSIRRQDDAPGRSLEDIIADSLDQTEHPAEFIRRTIAQSDRGVDAPARHWRHAPHVQFSAVFEALEWEAELRDAHGRPLDAAGFADLPWTVSLTDANGITREAPFEYPDTPLGDDNYPALVHAVNTRLLYGLGVEFVQLSDGTDRWRFALVETDELARLRDQYGLRVTVFDRPLLSAPQPPAYLPDEGGDVPLPDWVTATDRGPRLSRDRSDAADVVSSVETDVDSFFEDSFLVDPAEANDESGQPGDEEQESAAGRAANGVAETDSDQASASPFIDFVESEESTQTEESEQTEESNTAEETVPAPDTGVEQGEDGDGGGLESESDPFWDDTGDWSLEPVTGGDSAEPEDGAGAGDDESLAAETDASVDDGDDGGFELLGGGPSVSRQSTDDADPLDDLFDSVEESAATESAGRTDPEYDGFDADDLADFKRGARKARVENESFGVGVERPTEDDRLAAYGAAIDAGGNLSVRGLLDDDTFVPTFPAADPDEVRITYDDGCDLDAPPASEIETDEGFVWVNADGLSSDQRDA